MAKGINMAVDEEIPALQYVTRDDAINATSHAEYENGKLVVNDSTFRSGKQALLNKCSDHNCTWMKMFRKKK
jgi:hypothetical protein